MNNRIVSIIFMVVSMVIMIIVLHVYPDPVREPMDDNLYYEYNIVERIRPDDYNHAKGLLESAVARLDADVFQFLVVDFHCCLVFCFTTE